MRKLVALFILAAAAVAAAWWWLGRPLAAPAVATDPGRIQCMSFTPFPRDESPLHAATHAEAAPIEEDLSKLAHLPSCVRTYAPDNGLDQVPPIAQRLGIKVLQGLWLGRDREKNRLQIDTAIALAKRYPNAINGTVVGNEVLLRGELSVEDIAAVLREVKAATGMPVTYADVWEFWLRNRELAAAVDFITIHILPYWEDFPIAADIAAAHVDDIRSRVAAAFPGKEILIGEVDVAIGRGPGCDGRCVCWRDPSGRRPVDRQGPGAGGGGDCGYRPRGWHRGAVGHRKRGHRKFRARRLDTRCGLRGGCACGAGRCGHDAGGE